MRLAQHLPNGILLMAHGCSEGGLLMASSWASRPPKIQCREHGIDPASLETGMANSMELAQHLPNDMLPMAHGCSKAGLLIALSWPSLVYWAPSAAFSGNARPTQCCQHNSSKK